MKRTSFANPTNLSFERYEKKKGKSGPYVAQKGVLDGKDIHPLSGKKESLKKTKLRYQKKRKDTLGGDRMVVRNRFWREGKKGGDYKRRAAAGKANIFAVKAKGEKGGAGGQ